MHWALTGVVVAALVASSAAASTGALKQDGFIELCGPSGCDRTTDPGAVAQFKAFIPDPGGGSIPGFPPPVQAYYRLKADGLRFPAVFAGGSGQLGVSLAPGPPLWTDLGPITLAALAKVGKSVRPFAAPLPSSVLVDDKKVRTRPIYRHLFDDFPQAYNLQPSRQPWIGIAVKWPRGTPWPATSFTLRRGTRIMLRPDYAVRISKALAARIVADAPVKKKKRHA